MLERDSSTAQKAVAASTDLLHRRILLPYSFQFVLSESSVCIRTDSTLIREALDSLNIQADLVGVVANVEWEIAVETQRESEAAMCHRAEIEPIEVYRFGPSWALRMNSGSWFAYTPPSRNGVGFAMVVGSERDRIDRLSVYLRAIMSLLDDAGARSNPDSTLEVCA
ncbi:MAG: hypothetical protein ABSD44_03225 [Terracidiphilus sp.]